MRQQLAYFAPPIVELPEARTSKIATRRDLTPENRFLHAGAAEDCLQEECSVDTVQMLVGQLKTREQELAKKGRIVAARVKSHAIDAMPSQG